MHTALAFLAAFAAGAINSVAGGGTLVSFPALVGLGLPSITANATSTVAIWPGSLGGMLGFRRELRGMEPRMFALIVPSLIGGVVGAMLLKLTPTSVVRSAGAAADSVRDLSVHGAGRAVQRLLKIGSASTSGTAGLPARSRFSWRWASTADISASASAS